MENEDMIYKKFQMLYDKWHSETYILSNTELIITHSAFLDIVKIGHPAVKCIIEKLRERPSFIMYALPMILGYNIVNWKENGEIIPLDKQCKRWIEHFEQTFT